MFRHHPLKIVWLLLLMFAVGLTSTAQDLQNIDLKKPIKFSGSINLQLESYSASGIANRRKPFSWLVSGAPTVTILGTAVPFSFLFSNFENRYYQPFNQYGISPKFKWATVHAGYRNIQFSPFTLAGYRMLGGGVELNPKGFRFGFMYGRLTKSTAIDSAQFANPLAVRPTPTYTRMAYAAKIGVGSEKNYFDISYLKGWDKATSIEGKYRDSVAPAANHVIGLSWKLTLFKNISWQTEVGLSHYTADIYSEKVELDTSYDKILRRLAEVFDTRISSTLLTAGETRLAYQGKKFGVGVQYRRVDPEYQSMGAYFFQSDIEQYSLMPSVRLMKNKLILSGSVGFQRDNLYNQKLATSERITGNANINYNPSPVFGISFNYSNYGFTRNPLPTATTIELFKQVSQSFVLVPYLNIINERSIKNLSLVASLQALNSPVKSINTAPDQHTLFGTLIYNHTLTKQQLAFNASVNYNNTNVPTGDIGSYGGGLGATVPLLKQKLLFTANGTYNSNTYNGESNGYTLNGDAGFRIKVLKKSNLQLSFNYLKNEAKDQTAIQSFDEKTLRVGYGLSF